MFSNYSSPQQVIIIVGCCVLVCATWQIICTIHLTIMSPPHCLFVRPRKCKFSQHRFTARCLKSCRNHQTYPLRSLMRSSTLTAQFHLQFNSCFSEFSHFLVVVVSLSLDHILARIDEAIQISHHHHIHEIVKLSNGRLFLHSPLI